MFNPDPLYNLSNKELVIRIASSIKKYRLTLNLSQRELAEITGMDRSSIASFENGRPANLLSFLQILRGLNKLDVFNSLLQQETIISPVLLAKLKGKERKHASPKKQTITK